MKTKTITGWTNVSPVKPGDNFNRTQVVVCTGQRRGLCTSHGRKCYEQTPTCLDAALRMVGKKITFATRPSLTEGDKQEIARQLQAAYRVCYKVKIAIREVSL